MSSKQIVVGSALTPESTSAVRLALDLARMAGAQLCAVHAYHMPIQYYGGPPFEMADYDPAIEAAVVEEAGNQLARQLAEMDTTAVEVRSMVKRGPAHAAIVEAAREVEADLIVVGASERSRLEQRLLGSTTDRVIRSAIRPVLVSRSEFPGRDLKVLAPIDFSPLSEDALSTALATLDWLGFDVSVELFYVVEPPRAGAIPFDADQLEALAGAGLARATQGIARGKVSTSTTVRHGDPADEILSRVGEGGFDLIAMGTHGFGGFKRFLLGSVAGTVVREARVSTLVVPPTAARQHVLDGG